MMHPERLPASEGPQPSRRSDIAPFIVMDVMQAAAEREAEGHGVIHMEVGQPGTPAPRAALDRVARALARETLGYTVALGLPALRERIARHYAERHGVSVEPERVIVTTGSSAGFVLGFLALFDVGARVALPAPGYPCYRHILTALGQEPVPIVTDGAGRWMPTAAQIEEASRGQGIAGLVVASPANPTGTMLEPQRLAEIAHACRRANIWLVSDEIYHGLAYGMPEETALAHSSDAVVINSFSKYFSMTGWRIGWLVVPQRLVRPIERLAQNLYISPPTVAQVAALGAFDGMDELEANRRVYAENRELLLAELPRMGLGRIVPADGAFYLYVDVGEFTSDSHAFTKQMLAEIGVAATPGVDFDAGRGRRYVRFCYAGTTADMAEAARRLREWDRLRTRAVSDPKGQTP
jgi:aspartate/methionine/tyrosine aminotransferase